MKASLKTLVFAASLCAIAPPAAANSTIASRYVRDAALVGEAQFRVFVWNVYQAELYAPAGVYYPDQPFVLTLRYQRDFEGRQIINRTFTEMEGQGPLDLEQRAVWDEALNEIIPDVTAGTAIAGVRDEQGFTRFYVDGEFAGAVEDTEFTRRFFDIWLREDSSYPNFTKTLLGGA